MVKAQGYLSYMLRLWQTGEGNVAGWRASVHVIATGERRAFASLDELVAYLRDQTRAHPQQESAKGETREGHIDRNADAKRSA